jgi:hypothetical protein
MKFLLAPILIFILFLGASSAQARSRTNVTTLSLISQSGIPNQGSLNSSAPTSCVNEDDYYKATYSGSLYGNYSTTFEFCGGDYNGYYWNAGGEGIQTEVTFKGVLNDLTITSPNGTVTHSLNTAHTYQDCQGAGGHCKTFTTYSYQACVCPPYYAANDTGTSPLMGGTWTVTLSGQVSSATWTVQNNMTDVYFQQKNCPVSEQNIIY